MMEQQLSAYLGSLLGEFSLAAYLVVFAAGIVTSLGPCNLTMIPIIMAYIGGNHQRKLKSFWLSIAFTIGTSLTFMLLGILVSAMGGLFGNSRMFLNYFVALVALVMGLNLFGILNLRISLPWVGLLKKPKKKGILGAFLLGLVMGLTGSQCGTPVLLVILTLALSKGKLIYGATLLFIYGVGRGVPVVIAGTFTGIATGSPALMKWSATIEKIAGLVLIGFGFYFLWTG